MEAKTMTLVERLRSIDEFALHRAPEAVLDRIEEAICALEAAQKALEPFAEQANRMDASDLRMGESKREDSWEYWVKTGDLRLARSVHSKLKGEAS